MKLIVDTETTGLPPRRVDPINFIEWANCRIVQIAWVVIDVEGTIVKQADHIIKPCWFIIPDESTAIHGITQEFAHAQGKEIKDVLKEFIEDISRCDTLVAHNMDFDYNVIISEILRAGIDPCNMNHIYKYCTMRKGSLPNEKWQKLGELYKKYFGTESTLTLHRALNDVLMCKDIYMYQLHQL
jgi:DNA polymerase-3 subunit alpha